MICKYAEIFCWKNVSSFSHFFSAKNIRILYIESAKIVNEMTHNDALNNWAQKIIFLIFPQKYSLWILIRCVSSLFSLKNNKKKKYVCPKITNTKVSDKMTYANSADLDQTAPEGAVWSGSTLFAIPLRILSNKCIKTKFWQKYYRIKCSKF